MSSLGLCLHPILAQRQQQRINLEQLSIAGGASTSIFPLVEDWLQASTDHWNALRAVAARKTDPGFRSVVDFLVVGVCPEFQIPCERFYEGKGPPLRNLVSEERRKYVERRVLCFLEVAYAAFLEKRRLSWSTALELVFWAEVAV